MFDEPDERQRFAAHVAAALGPGGLWLSLIGSTEGPARDVGPPRRSAREVTLAIEPALEIVELRSAEFRGQLLGSGNYALKVDERVGLFSTAHTSENDHQR